MFAEPNAANAAPCRAGSVVLNMAITGLNPAENTAIIRANMLYTNQSLPRRANDAEGIFFTSFSDERFRS